MQKGPITNPNHAPATFTGSRRSWPLKGRIGFPERGASGWGAALRPPREMREGR